MEDNKNKLDDSFLDDVTGGVSQSVEYVTTACPKCGAGVHIQKKNINNYTCPRCKARVINGK